MQLTALRNGKMVAAAAMFMALCAFGTSHASAQKNISFSTSGTVSGTLVFSNFLVPDVYAFYANPGEQIRLQTGGNGSGANVLDTTIRVVAPNAAINLFDDNSAGNLASRVVFTTSNTGWYTVIVSTSAGLPIGANDNNGRYTLTLARGAAAAALEAGAEAPSSGGSNLPPETPTEMPKP